MMLDIMRADSETDAGAALADFKAAFGAKHEKAVDLLKKDWPEPHSLFQVSRTSLAVDPDVEPNRVDLCNSQAAN